MQLKVRVIPKSGKNAIDEKIMADGTIKVRLTTAPEKGKANEALVKLLAKHFKVKANNIKILKGQTDKNKIIEIC